ncbi:uncharacterized protein LOC107039911 [Diachasma alloeum]|uniref:uncharacterized protein LOC107039911 n=1 Tax=Diachasma alloeum TaxID=454923 RepID=UPI0007383A3C|nr:uncharacterized protein LOC107039911 [Diachasma alloeum]
MEDQQLLLDMTVRDMSGTTYEKVANGEGIVDVSMNTVGKEFHDIINAEVVFGSDDQPTKENPKTDATETALSTQPAIRKSDVPIERSKKRPRYLSPIEVDLSQVDHSTQKTRIHQVHSRKERPIDLDGEKQNPESNQSEPSSPNSNNAKIKSNNLQHPESPSDPSLTAPPTKASESELGVKRVDHPTREPQIHQVHSEEECPIEKSGEKQNPQSNQAEPSSSNSDNAQTKSNNLQNQESLSEPSLTVFPINASDSELGTQRVDALDEVAKLGKIQKPGNPRGAPKGRKTTTIGLPIKKPGGIQKNQQNRRKRGIAFTSRNTETKTQMLVTWLLGKYDEHRNFEASTIRTDEVDYTHLDNSFIDTPPDDLKLLMKLMEHDAQKQFSHHLTKKRNADDFKCFVCAHRSHPLCPSVLMCDGCLKWHHLMCVGMKNSPAGKWYCSECSART